MPTVLGGKGKLSIVCFLLRCACSQDMTQSWPSQQALGGDPAQRILYSPKNAKQSIAQQRQGRGDVQLRMTRHPHVAPHKSMLADDLKLSSDDDDTQRVVNESVSWDRHSLSTHRAHTHGRRVRHSSSDSSGSDSTAESGSSSLHSRSPSPDVHPDPASPANTQPCSNKETDHPPGAQWQLDKWLKKYRKKSASSEQDPSQSTTGRQLSPLNQRAPSPDRSWDSNLEYSPSQSPIPSPQFNYSHNNSPLPSPGYSYCPSPSPFPSTCPSPSPSPSPIHSLIPSPGLSPCPSLFGSPRDSRSPSPLPRDPPKSPSPTLPPASRVQHYPEVQSQNQTETSSANSHKTKSRSWITRLPNTDTKNKTTNISHSQPTHQHRPKTQLRQDQDQSQSKPKGSAVLNSTQSHSHKSRPKSNFQLNSKQNSEAPKAKHALHFEQIQGSTSQHSSNLNTKCLLQPSTQHNSTRSKHLVPATRESQAGQSTQSTSKAASNSGFGLNSRVSPSLKPRAKSWEATVPTPAHVNHTKTAEKKSQNKEGQVDNRGDRLTHREGKKQKKKEDRHKEKQQGKQERKEDRRLAEEQLLRRPWIQSSTEEEEEEEEEEGVTERQKRREELAKGENRRRREQQHRREWQRVQTKQRPSTDTKRHCLREDSQHQGRTKKGRKSEQDRDLQPDSPPPVSRSLTRRRPSSSSSSSSSSNSDSDSEQAQIIKVPADSTSHKRLIKRGQQGPARSDTNRPKVVHPPGVNSANPSEGQQSQGKKRLYTLVPFGRSDKSTVPSQRGLRNLVVQIDLCLLKRVPDSTTTPSDKKQSPQESSSSSKEKQKEAMKHLCTPETVTKDNKRKRKLENGESHRESKRIVPHTAELSDCTESSAHTADRNIITETTHNGYLEEYLDSKRPLSPLSPLAVSPVPTKTPSKTKTSEQHNSITHKNRDNSRESAVKPNMEVECVKVSRQPQAPCKSWGPAGQRGTVPNHDTPHHAEYYLHEAKRMKHRADAMVDKLGKAVNYVDAALSFMECGKAMEEGPLEAKSPYTMYSETVELIRYAMRLKSHSGPAARQEDKQLAVLCFRCLALLYWQMFRLKKDHALKYSKVLLDYFKSSPKVPTTPPRWSDSEKGTEGPPPSFSPNSKHHGRVSHGSSTSPSFISIPQRIHQMAANHLNITNSVLYSYEYWEVADNLAKENKEFFNYLNTLSGPLTLHSSIAHTVQYTRQALQWIRISAKLN
ncbi:AF4/FMR2 family member 3 isoform X2 [Echeneis naucrates]|uniref:AF4/FMR2 family member 3 isoform X2 n=1 Tax=Echeneis naucrates TaxID=173247 RepID=UPI00111352D4|nr:AF4/FMR2 family member 3 isoform X2 [Echeneis naucrates]